MSLPSPKLTIVLSKLAIVLRDYGSTEFKNGKERKELLWWSPVKNLPADVGDIPWVHSLGRESSLEEDMATHSSIHAWRIPWTEEPGGL